MTTSEKKSRQMPKGGRKGGSVFPRVPLADALVYAKKLVSKTHVGPQPRDVILIGVIGSKHDKGEIAMSALRQYGLMKGDTKSNFSAEVVAKKISAAPPEELISLYRLAALKPTIFRSLFETFHSDTVTKARLKQRAADLKVHPDETGRCVDLYVASMVTAGLVTVSGEQVTHVASVDAVAPSQAEPAAVSNGEMDLGEAAAEDSGENIVAATTIEDIGTDASAQIQGVGTASPPPRAVFNVNVTLDSSMDIEKLQKQLELLKRFGAI